MHVLTSIKSMDNQAMFWQGKFPVYKRFTALYRVLLWNFTQPLASQRDVGSRPDVKYYGLRALTSCRWLFDTQETMIIL